MKRITALLLALLLLPALALGALAADVPEPSEDFYVYDGAGTLSQAQSEMSAAESAIYAMSRVFAAPGRGPRALSRRPSRRRRRRP